MEVIALRVLIVDDNQHFLDAARDLLEREGMSVVGLVSTGDDAVVQAGELHPDVILVDVDLGTESGFDVVRRLAERNETPMVLISAYTEVDLADLVGASPAVGFVSKSELSAHRIRDLLRDADYA